MTRNRAFSWLERPRAENTQQTVGLQFLPYALMVISATAQASWEVIMRDIFIKASEIYFSFLPSSFKNVSAGFTLQC